MRLLQHATHPANVLFQRVSVLRAMGIISFLQLAAARSLGGAQAPGAIDEAHSETRASEATCDFTCSAVSSRLRPLTRTDGTT